MISCLVRKNNWKLIELILCPMFEVISSNTIIFLHYSGLRGLLLVKNFYQPRFNFWFPLDLYLFTEHIVWHMIFEKDKTRNPPTLTSSKPQKPPATTYLPTPTTTTATTSRVGKSSKCSLFLELAFAIFLIIRHLSTLSTMELFFWFY